MVSHSRRLCGRQCLSAATAAAAVGCWSILLLCSSVLAQPTVTRQAVPPFTAFQPIYSEFMPPVLQQYAQQSRPPHASIIAHAHATRVLVRHCSRQQPETPTSAPSACSVVHIQQYHACGVEQQQQQRQQQGPDTAIAWSQGSMSHTLKLLRMPQTFLLRNVNIPTDAVVQP
jgi:hypothetical protein